MNSRLFKVIWLPVIGIWALFVVIYIESIKASSGLIGLPVLPIVYVVVSAFLAYKLKDDLEPGRNGDSIITVAKGYAAIGCLGSATVISFIGILLYQSANPWFCIAVAACPIALIVIEGLSGYSEEQLTEGFEHRSAPRAKANEDRKLFKAYLNTRINSVESVEPEVAFQLHRILQIVDYSSFFMENDARNLIEKLDLCSSPTDILRILKEVK